MTAMGDAVNVAARLGGSAGGGELLVSAASAAAAGVDGSAVERRRLALRGKSEPTDVLVLLARRPSSS
jgi:class 3 adenylate cyclase